MKPDELIKRVLEGEDPKKAFSKIRRLRQKGDKLVDEYEYVTLIHKALEKQGHTMEDVAKLIPRGIITDTSDTKARRFNVDWTGAGPDDIVGAELNDGTEILFERPIRHHGEPKLGKDPFAPSGTHRSKTHERKVRDFWGDNWSRPEDLTKDAYKIK